MTEEQKIREEIQKMIMKEAQSFPTVLLIQSKIDDLCLEVFTRGYKQASIDAVKIVNQGKRSIASSD